MTARPQIPCRCQLKSTLIPTNPPFAEWRGALPHAGCAASLIDRLVRGVEIVALEGDSYRFKEARERTGRRARVLLGGKP